MTAASASAASLSFETAFPIWPQLAPEHRRLLLRHVQKRTVAAGDILHDRSAQCTGLLLVCSGQLRAFMLSGDGREITLYRLLDRDLCLFSASCVLRSVQFDVTIEAEKDTTLWVVPAEVFKAVMAQSLPLANYTNEVMASRFSDVMWLMEQILWYSVDKRLAAFLMEERALQNTPVLAITHDAIGRHMGNPREVITRMLRYFQSEGMVRLSRGTVQLTDEEKLKSFIE